jgi:hypothetical protein
MKFSNADEIITISNKYLNERNINYPEVIKYCIDNDITYGFNDLTIENYSIK